ncbi:MAG: DUF3488 and DUF4129 domain-containing transglutaminase family protein [bacterium]
MKDRKPGIEIRHYLILLGLICHGFVWELWFMPLIMTGLWMVAIMVKRDKRYLSQTAEAVIFFLVLVGGFKIKPSSGHIWFTALGNALAVTQLIRMTWPSNRRERILSTAMAITHVAVGSQVVFNYPFALILIAAIILIPTTLNELEVRRFKGTYTRPPDLINWQRTAGVFAFMMVFFLFFPRWQLSPFSGRFGLRRRGFVPELNSARGGNQGTHQLVLRIEGRDVTYLRCLALDTFRDNTWRAGKAIYQFRKQPVSGEGTGSVYRRVTVAAPDLVGSMLPVDGQVVDMEGFRYRKPYPAEFGGFILPFNRNQPFTYEYWTVPGPLADDLHPNQKERYLRHPPFGPKIDQWLDQLIGHEEDPLRRATILVNYFLTEFNYTIGAPDLNRHSALEEFLFEKREGHCERFASALTLLLRGSGIPARVVIGYVATERNPLGGFYNVRARHAHAWTEAWFEGKGWITLDATPFGTGLDVEYGRFVQTFYEWIEYVWYSKIVDFGSSDQIRLVSGIGGGIAAVVRAVRKGWNVLAIALGGIFALILLRSLAPLVKRPVMPRKPRDWTAQEAHHFYGRMLRVLARQHLIRSPSQTPLEFLRFLEENGHERMDDIRLITFCFCDVRYGRTDLPPSTAQELKSALKRIIA